MQDTDKTWGGFFECRDVNKQKKTPAERAACWDETTGLAFGVDVPLLRQVLQMIQVRPRCCAGCQLYDIHRRLSHGRVALQVSGPVL